MITFCIYALTDPTTNEIRYVGCSKSPNARFHQHLTYGRKQDSRMSTGEWIGSLLQEGLRPKLIILEEYTADWKSEAREVEAQWIHHSKNEGAQLLNRQIAKQYCRYSKILPDRQPKLRHEAGRGWYYTYDY